jgi:uncharacterized metal-binding protein
MIDTLCDAFAIASTIVGAIGILAVIIYLSGLVLFQAVDVVMKILKLKSLFIEFLSWKYTKKYEVYSPKTESVSFNSNTDKKE